MPRPAVWKPKAPGALKAIAVAALQCAIGLVWRPFLVAAFLQQCLWYLDLRRKGGTLSGG